MLLSYNVYISFQMLNKNYAHSILLGSHERDNFQNNLPLELQIIPERIWLSHITKGIFFFTYFCSVVCMQSLIGYGSLTSYFHLGYRIAHQSDRAVISHYAFRDQSSKGNKIF